MAKKAYIGVDGVARKIKKGYLGIPKNLLSEPSAMLLSGTSVSNGVISFPVNGSVVLIQQSVATPVAGHKYYTRLAYNAPSGLSSTVINVQMWVNDYAGGYISFYSAATFPTQDSQWRTLSAVREAPSSPASGSWVFRSYVYAGNVACQMKELFLIDLTEIFGAGNEPSKEWCDASIGYSVGTGESVSVARKIKKAYIGIGGVARPCWSGGELAYYGTITPLSSARMNLAATNVGNHALFAGGQTSSSGWGMTVVDAYDTALTRTSPNVSIHESSNLAATHIGDYALFGGGSITGSASDGSTYMTAISASLTKTSQKSIGNRGYLSATTVGNYALFGGGYHSSSPSSTVTSCNESLTIGNATALSAARRYLSATTVGNYALFGGGQPKSGYSNAVDTYDTSLTKGTATALSESKRQLAATTVGNYALFGGGSAYGYCSTVDAYDASLTRSTPTALSEEKYWLTATSVGDYALFGGGGMSGDKVTTTVDVYDKSLTKTTMALGTARQALTATAIGNYALFGGGTTASSALNTVEAFTVA